MYGYVVGRVLNAVDPLGTRFILVQEDRTLAEIRQYGSPNPNRLAFTVHEHLSDTGQDVIKTFKKSDCDCYCAYVETAKEMNLRVTNWNPSDGLNTVYTSNGLLSIQMHEWKRIDVKAMGYNAFLKPASSAPAITTCGTVCRKIPGEARDLLLVWLGGLRISARRQFERYNQAEQAGISTENLPENQLDRVEMNGRQLFNGIKNWYDVKRPGKLVIPKCSKSDC